jgi:hypothetical protein
LEITSKRAMESFFLTTLALLAGPARPALADFTETLLGEPPNANDMSRSCQEERTALEVPIADGHRWGSGWRSNVIVIVNIVNKCLGAIILWRCPA